MSRARLPVRTAAAVAAGGFVGTLLRYGLGVASPDPAAFPWTTLGINVGGSLVLGVLTGMWLAGGPGADSVALRAAVGPGLLGAFTTFSAVAVHVAAAATSSGAPSAAQAGAYLAASLVAGLAAAAAGLWLGGTRSRRGRSS
jgi:CrcB protein